MKIKLTLSIIISHLSSKLLKNKPFWNDNAYTLRTEINSDDYKDGQNIVYDVVWHLTKKILENASLRLRKLLLNNILCQNKNSKSINKMQKNIIFVLKFI